jgi:DNA-binding response OmpR family regulator
VAALVVKAELKMSPTVLPHGATSEWRMNENGTNGMIVMPTYTYARKRRACACHGRRVARSMKILLVEDDPGIRGLVEDVLVTDHGHEVVAVGSAEEGWEAWHGADFSLLILDWMLPGMDGLELCRRLRLTPAGEASVILVMTGRTQADDLAAVLDAGADDYLAKPLDLQLLEIRLAIAERRVKEVADRLDAQRAAQQAAKLEGVLLAARTAAHEINNALALPVGFAELLTLHPTIQADPSLLSQVISIRDQSQRAAEILASLQRVIRLEETPSPLGPDRPYLDITRSVGDEPSPLLQKDGTED